MSKYSDQLDPLFAALAHPARRSIVTALASGDKSVTDLAQPFQMSLPSIHQHLQVLEDSGLIQSRKTGRVRVCALNAPALIDVRNWMDDQQHIWETRTDQLEAFLTMGKDI